MALDVFQLRDRVVEEYRDYVQSFVRVLDDRIDDFISSRLNEGELWPAAELQLNPAFEMDRTLGELATQGIIKPETARFFGEELRLFQHQREAIDIALRGESYVVTTGTGSGKSLTYLVPVFDAIIRNQPDRHSVRTLLIYPMNALINSQLEALRSFQRRNFPDSPVRFDRYTGQGARGGPSSHLERSSAHPSYQLRHGGVHLSPTHRAPPAPRSNERPQDFGHGRAAFLQRTTRRGCGDAHPQASGERRARSTSRSHQRHYGHRRFSREPQGAVSDLASRFFGLNIPAQHVVDETLRRVALVLPPQQSEEVRAAVEASPPVANAESVRRHPLTAWTEEAFGLKDEAGRLVRRSPETFEAAVRRLAEDSGLPAEQCMRQLRAVLEAGNEAEADEGHPIFAFRLHQWLSSGNSIYATLEPPDIRECRMEGQYRADDERVLFPLAFCRECGQEYYLVSRIEEQGVEHLFPRSPMAGNADEDVQGEDGFFAVEHRELWAGDDEELPEVWFNERRSGRVIKPDYAPFRPQCTSQRPTEGSTDPTALE